MFSRNLIQFDPDDERIILTMKRTQFERWQSAASDAYANNELETCITALDSALNIFPKHKQCLEMKGLSEKELNRTQAVVPTTPEVVAPAPISSELRKEIESTYNTAREHFKKGDLSLAVRYWERVERIAPDYMSVREYLVRAYKFIGVELYGQNQLQDAIAVWEKASQLDPGNQEIRDYIKRTNNEMRKLEELSYEHE